MQQAAQLLGRNDPDAQLAYLAEHTELLIPHHPLQENSPKRTEAKFDIPPDSSSPYSPSTTHVPSDPSVPSRMDLDDEAPPNNRDNRELVTPLLASHGENRDSNNQRPQENNPSTTKKCHCCRFL